MKTAKWQACLVLNIERFQQEWVDERAELHKLYKRIAKDVTESETTPKTKGWAGVVVAQKLRQQKVEVLVVGIPGRAEQ